MPSKFSTRTANRSSNVQQTFGDFRDPFYELALRFMENQAILDQFMSMEAQAPGLFDTLNAPHRPPKNLLFPNSMAQHPNPFMVPLQFDPSTGLSIPMSPWDQGGAMPQMGGNVATFREGAPAQRSLSAPKGDKPKRKK